MKKLGIVVSAIILIIGLVSLGLFFASLPGILNGDSDGLVYLITLPASIYSIVILTRLLKDKEFDQTHKLTLHLLTWPTIFAVLISIFFLIASIVSGEALGIWAAVLALVFGSLIATILSFIGFIIKK